MPFLPQVFRRPRKPSRQSRPASLRVPPLILRLVTWQRTSFSEPLVFSGISGLSSTITEGVKVVVEVVVDRSSATDRPFRRPWRRLSCGGGTVRESGGCCCCPVRWGRSGLCRGRGGHQG